MPPPHPVLSWELMAPEGGRAASGRYSAHKCPWGSPHRPAPYHTSTVSPQGLRYSTSFLLWSPFCMLCPTYFHINCRINLSFPTGGKKLKAYKNPKTVGIRTRMALTQFFSSRPQDTPLNLRALYDVCDARVCKGHGARRVGSWVRPVYTAPAPSPLSQPPATS